MRQENSSLCEWRNSVASMIVWPSDQVEIMVKPVMTSLMCLPSDMGWITVKPDFY